MTMATLHHNKLCIVLGLYVLGLRLKITSIQAWNFQGVRPSKSVDARVCSNDTGRKADSFTCKTTPISPQMVAPPSRRQVLSSFPAALSASLVFSWPAPQAFARNMPLSNGADTSKVGTVTALIPIVKLKTDLETLQQNLKDEYKKSVDGPLKVISKTKTSFSFGSGDKSATIPIVEKDFKRVFDAYSDQVSYKQKFLDNNAFLVYYTNGYDGPGRDSLEKDPVNERQTLQFGARNEAWIDWDDFLAEWEYYSSSGRSNSSDAEESFSEMNKYLSNTIQAVDRYLRLSPPQDLEAVQQGNL